jgi:hypothetical protein
MMVPARSDEYPRAPFTRPPSPAKIPRMRTTWRRALGGLVGMGIVTTAAAPAHALDQFDRYFIAGVVISLIPDVTFATYDIVVASKGELPSHGWSVAETALTVPQTSFGYIASVALQGKGNDENSATQVLVLIPTIGVSILSTHGIWSTATTNVRSSVLAGTSAAVGADAALTTGVLTRTFTGHLSSRAVGITGMVFTAPQVAVASYLGATSPSSRAGWIALSAWSGGLFLHGLASAIAGNHNESPPPAPAPAPPAPPLSPALPPGQAPSPAPTAPSARPPLLVPGSLRMGPMIVSDGVASAPGIGVSGVLF